MDTQQRTFHIESLTLGAIQVLRNVASTRRADMLLEISTEPYTGNILDMTFEADITVIVHTDGMSLDQAVKLCELEDLT